MKMANTAQIRQSRRELDGYAADGIRQELFQRSLDMLPTGRLIDLGAGHCVFAIQAHKSGWDSTGLDVRTERLLKLPAGVKFIEGDVSGDAWNPADYDVVSCLGLYYHLDQAMQHTLLARIAGKPLILDTHVATTDGSGWFTQKKQITSLVNSGTEQGAWFDEAPNVSPEERKQSALRASFHNDRSWWPTMPSLLSTLRMYGYRESWVAAHPYTGAQRTFIVAFPS